MTGHPPDDADYDGGAFQGQGDFGWQQIDDAGGELHSGQINSDNDFGERQSKPQEQMEHHSPSADSGADSPLRPLIDAFSSCLDLTLPLIAQAWKMGSDAYGQVLGEGGLLQISGHNPVNIIMGLGLLFWGRSFSNCLLIWVSLEAIGLPLLTQAWKRLTSQESNEDGAVINFDMMRFLNGPPEARSRQFKDTMRQWNGVKETAILKFVVAFYTMLLGVFAVLNSHLARQIAVGNAIGYMLGKHMETFCKDSVESFIAENLLPRVMGLRTFMVLSRVLGFVLAVFLGSGSLRLYGALLGAQIAMKELKSLLGDDTLKDYLPMLQCILALGGLYSQRHSGDPGFLMSLVLLPGILLEGVAKCVINFLR